MGIDTVHIHRASDVSAKIYRYEYDKPYACLNIIVGQGSDETGSTIYIYMDDIERAQRIHDAINNAHNGAGNGGR